VIFVLLCSFAGGVESIFPPLEEPVVCEFCVELPCSICLALLLCILAFGIAYVT
jgi:hypothetical protein